MLILHLKQTANPRLLLLIFSFATLTYCAKESKASLLLEIQEGKIEGYADKRNKIWGWKNLPFAKPPVGPLRWRAPEDPEAWDGVRQAKEECTPCTQMAGTRGWLTLPEVIGSEDCLYLNVYRPATEEENLPVYFWIHGGANNTGAADAFDLENLARVGNMVVVVVQYRLNVFGFFTHPSIRAGLTPEDASGNYGLLDLVKALQWARRNISVFGGDPQNITIAGESAGGHNVMGLMLSSLSRGLFQRAIMQSGGMISQSVELSDAIANKTLKMARIMNKDAEGEEEGVAEFLRSLSAEELLMAHAGGPDGVTVPLANHIEDGVVIPGNLLCSIEAGNYHKVPLMLGANQSEAGSINTLIPPLYEGMPNFTDLLQVVEGQKELDEVLSTQDDKDLWTNSRDYASKFWRAAMLDELARRVSQHQEDVYAYSFNWGEEDVRPGPVGFIYGAAHALELPFFHGSFDNDDLTEPSMLIYTGFTSENLKGRKALSRAIISYIAAFCQTGNPNTNASELPTWQAWSSEENAPKLLILDADLEQATISMSHEAQFMVDVQLELESEAPALNTQLRNLFSVVLPYSFYEGQGYSYNPCR